jgi:O-antigen ligase
VFRPDQNRAALMADSLRTVAGVVLLTALGVAPLNYGSTRLMPFETLIALVATAGAAWLLAGACVRAWALPPVPVRWGTALVVVTAALWAFVWTRPELPAFTQAHVARLQARWPHSLVPRAFGLVATWAVVGAVGLWALCDLLREPVWRRAAAVVMVATGAGVAALGLAQNATHAAGIYWTRGPRMPGAFFATFYHHTSAGAYLNSVWPLGLGLVLCGVQRGAHSPRRRLAIYAALGATGLILAGHAGHVSRLPQVIAVVVLAGFAVWAGLWRALARLPGLRPAALAVAGALAAGVVVLGATRVGDIRQRWQLLRLESLRGGAPAVAPLPPSEWPRAMRDDLFVPSDHRQYPLGDRGATYAAAIAAVRDRPWFGWGPGGWTAAAAAHSVDPFVRTFFLIVQFTHDDFLQTCVEWGLVGAAGWLLLLPGSVVHGLARLRLRPAAVDPLGAAAVAGLVAVFAQSVIDFPLQIPAIQFNAVTLAALAWTVPSAPALST